MNKFLVLLLVFFTIPSLQAQISQVDSTSIQMELDSLWVKPFSEETKRSCQRIIHQSQQVGFKKGEAIAHQLIGNYSVEVGQSDTALFHYQKHILIAESLEDSTLLANGYFSFAVINSTLGELEKSISFFEKTMEVSKRIKDEVLYAASVNGLGVAHSQGENYDKAIDYLKQAKALMSKIDALKGVQNANFNIAYIYLLQKKPLAAKSFAFEYLDFAKSKKDSIDMASGYSIIGKVFRGEKNFTQALNYCDSSLQLIELNKMKTLKAEVLLEISGIYEDKKDAKKAFEFYEKYHEANQEFINEQTKKNIAELDVKFETEKKQKELVASQKAKTELEQTAQIRKQRLWLIGIGLIASLLISFLIFYKFKSAARKKEIEEKLIRMELKNKELEAIQLKSQLTSKEADVTNLALDIGRKNDFSNQLIQQLEKLQQTKPNQLKSELREVISFAINHLQINEDLAHLQNNIDTVNRAFYKNLEDKFGQLTANEKYLSGLIRLNLSNKDIAAIRGISTSSAKMSRHRLRKKFDLDSETDIAVFLQNI